MALSIVIMIMWFILGIYGYVAEKKGNFVPFVLFISIIPFFPWIFKFCGVI